MGCAAGGGEAMVAAGLLAAAPAAADGHGSLGVWAARPSGVELLAAREQPRAVGK